MNDVITIENTEMQIKEYNRERVVTFKDIDAVHKRPAGTAKRNFNKNKKHFIEGEDYIKVCADEIRTNKIMDISSKTRNDVVMMTESGYLLLVKSFTDDLSWNVQRQLVNAYFKVREVQKEPYYKEPLADDFTPRVPIVSDWQDVPTLQRQRKQPQLSVSLYLESAFRKVRFGCSKGDLQERGWEVSRISD